MNKDGHAFTSELLWVSIVHSVLIGMLLGFALFRGCEEPKDLNLPFELIVPVPGDAEEDAGEPEEVKPQPGPEPDKDDVPDSDVAKPDVRKPDVKKPDVKKPDVKKSTESVKKPDSAKTIKVSTKLIRRGSSPGKSKTTLSAEEIERLLARGAKTGKPTLTDSQIRSLLNGTTKFGTGTPMTRDMLYFEIVRQALYRSWNQPTQLGIAGLVTHMELSLNPDGSISGSRMTASSGNATMDESVARAIRSVRRIAGIPAEFALSHRRIPVAFELTGSN